MHVERDVNPNDASAADRSLNGAIGAHMSWFNTPNRPARTAPARAALERRFLDEADGDPVRAEHLRKAHFLRLAQKSAQARRARKTANRLDAEVESDLETSAKAQPPDDLVEQIARLVKDVPDEQRDRLAVLLLRRGVGA